MIDYLTVDDKIVEPNPLPAVFQHSPEVARTVVGRCLNREPWRVFFELTPA